MATPGVTTIAALAEFLQVEPSATAKAVFLVAEIEQPDGKVQEQFVFCVVRGDMELNETKLTNAIRARRLRSATAPEIQAVGAEPGYGSPVGVRREALLLVVDDLVARSPNLVAGANRAGYHLLNTNYGREYIADQVVDLAAASDGHSCLHCGAPVYTARGVEVGNIFKLGTKYSIAMGATYLDENGEEKPIVMGSYGIGSGRLMAVIVELHHDEAGIQWPITVAPYQVMLVSLATEKTPEVTAAADQLYADLVAAGVEVLYDDRDERAGVKFNDADLLGIPIRLTLGAKGLKNGVVEGKLRRNGESLTFAVGTVVAEVQALIAAEITRIQATVLPVPFEG